MAAELGSIEMVFVPVAFIREQEQFRRETVAELARIKVMLLTDGSGYLNRRQAMKFLGMQKTKFNDIRKTLVRTADGRYCVESCRAYLQQQRISPDDIARRIDDLLCRL